MSSFASHYASLSGEELADLSRKALLTEARVALDAEISRRGILPEQLNSMIAESAAERDYLVRLGARRRRYAAFKIDLVGVPLLFGLALMPFNIAFSAIQISAFAVLLITYLLLKDGIRGQSIGKRLLGLQVVDRESEHPCTWKGSLIRNSTLAIFPIDLLFLLSDEKMRLGDKIAKTKVVKTLTSN